MGRPIPDAMAAGERAANTLRVEGKQALDEVDETAEEIGDAANAVTGFVGKLEKRGVLNRITMSLSPLTIDILTTLGPEQP